MVERLVRDQVAAGSNPVTLTLKWKEMSDKFCIKITQSETDPPISGTVTFKYIEAYAADLGFKHMIGWSLKTVRDECEKNGWKVG